MAVPTKRNEIRLDIITKCAAPSHVVNIEILKAATYLTAPSIALQDFFPQPRIRHGRHSDSSLLRKGVAHFTSSGGSASYVAVAQPNDAEDSEPCMELSVSKAAPARKSAQIISSE